jgi:hypothetical protein
MYKLERVARIALLVVAASIQATMADAQNSPPENALVDGWPPVPPLKEQSVIGNYCIHRNLIYSMGDVLCVGGQGLVCAPPPGPGTGGRAYWSSVPVSRGDVNWAPPAHCGK